LDAKGGGEGMHYEVGIRQRSKLDEPETIRKIAEKMARHFNRNAGFPDAPGAHDANEWRFFYEGLDPFDIVVTS
jgi:hypothetical protein